MRTFHAAIVSLCCFLASAAAWTKEDHEIFRSRDEIQVHEGENATFYSFLGVKPSATLDEINKAYRKQSRVSHPDKARQSFIASYNKPPKAKAGKKPTVHVTKNKQPSQRELSAFNKEASARFARSGVVADISRGPDRERYDHFLYNGFPVWRGTGYYYQRYRPGSGSVSLGLFVFVGGGAHYVASYSGWKRQREFIDRYIKHARRMAWGDESSIAAIPGLGTNGNGTATPPVAQQESEEEQAVPWNRREKRRQEKENRRANKNPKAAKAVEKARTSGISTPQEAESISGPVGAKKRTVAENGKISIVDSAGNVYSEEETEEGDVHEYSLDVDEIPAPTIYDTVLVKSPKWTYNQTLGKLSDKRTVDAEMVDLVGEAEDVEEADAALKAAVAPNKNSEARKRRSKARPQ